MLIFSKNADISKTEGVLVLKLIFSKTTCAYLRTKLQGSSINLTSVRQGVNVSPFHRKTNP